MKAPKKYQEEDKIMTVEIKNLLKKGRAAQSCSDLEKADKMIDEINEILKTEGFTAHLLISATDFQK
jgi:hypothetical protein